MSLLCLKLCIPFCILKNLNPLLLSTGPPITRHMHLPGQKLLLPLSSPSFNHCSILALFQHMKLIPILMPLHLMPLFPKFCSPDFLMGESLTFIPVELPFSA